MSDPSLDRDQALDALADLARTLAHDLNQPLAAASNYVAVARQIANTQAPAATGLAAALEKTEGQIVRATEAVRRMRSALAPIEPEMAACSLHALIRQAWASAEAQPDNEAVLRLRAADDAILADAAQIEAALRHLLLVAGKSTADAIVTWSNDEAIVVELHGSAAKPGEHSPAATLEWAIAARILRAHDGMISLDRTDAGLAIRIVLPLAQPGAGDSAV